MRFKSDSDKWLTINALHLAKSTYQDAATNVGPTSMVGQQLVRQAADCARVAEQIEEEA